MNKDKRGLQLMNWVVVIGLSVIVVMVVVMLVNFDGFYEVVCPIGDKLTNFYFGIIMGMGLGFSIASYYWTKLIQELKKQEVLEDE